MATGSDQHRRVTVQRTGSGRFTARNAGGGQLSFGSAGGAGFTPVELLLAAIGGCTAVDVDTLTSRRAEPEEFEVVVDAEKVRDEGGNHLTDIQVTFRLRFPATEQGDAARAILPDIVHKSHDRLCSVSRTIELGTPVTFRIG